WDGPRRTRGYAVQDEKHWAFAGTGLARGDRFGEHSRPPLVGYECDGAPLASIDEATGLAELAPDRERFGTPESFRALAVGTLASDWQELPPREHEPAGGGIHAAVMGVYSRGGTVFTAGTTDWAQALESRGDPRIETITRNVLDRLLSE
ncbi:MAG TPA: N,N-dimethylformamidase beta subunit family domain-containing protein, partial [Gammaproteobacteria bacterium]|nr:N,N-dimethylformamidase beta subunit family domain-containing protein [Gammaproteobacteria bacterium]